MTASRSSDGYEGYPSARRHAGCAVRAGLRASDSETGPALAQPPHQSRSGDSAVDGIELRLRGPGLPVPRMASLLRRPHALRAGATGALEGGNRLADVRRRRRRAPRHRHDRLCRAVGRRELATAVLVHLQPDLLPELRRLPPRVVGAAHRARMARRDARHPPLGAATRTVENQ